MSLQSDIFNTSISLFSADSEETRTAAAFAAGKLSVDCDSVVFLNFFDPVGNMAIGNVPHFLPAVINLVQSNNEKRLLALHALKEVTWLNDPTSLAYAHAPTSSRSSATALSDSLRM
jgi:cullin-associated NEDD8-dissociated protein 1